MSTLRQLGADRGWTGGYQRDAESDLSAVRFLGAGFALRHFRSLGCNLARSPGRLKAFSLLNGSFGSITSATCDPPTIRIGLSAALDHQRSPRIRGHGDPAAPVSTPMVCGGKGLDQKMQAGKTGPSPFTSAHVQRDTISV